MKVFLKIIDLHALAKLKSVTIKAKRMRAETMVCRKAQEGRWENAILKFGYCKLESHPMSGLVRFHSNQDPLMLGAAAIAGEKAVVLLDKGYMQALTNEKTRTVHNQYALNTGFPAERVPGPMEIRDAILKEWKVGYELASALAKSKHWRSEFLEWMRLKKVNDEVWSRAMDPDTSVQEICGVSKALARSKKVLHQLIRRKLEMVDRARDTIKYAPMFVFGGLLKPTMSVSEF